MSLNKPKIDKVLYTEPIAQSIINDKPEKKAALERVIKVAAAHRKRAGGRGGEI